MSAKQEKESSGLSLKEATYCHEVKNRFTPLPKLLCSLYSSTVVKTANEALVIVLHCLMVETGYIPLNVDSGRIKESMPENWKNTTGIYKIEYSHKNYPKVSLQVTFVPLGCALPVHGTLMTEASTSNTSAVLTIDDYIIGTRGFSDPVEVYRRLHDLSLKFKDGFAYSLLAELEHVLGISPSFGLAGLPIDAKFHLLGYLPVESIVALSASNKEFYHLTNCNFIWKCLYLRDFPESDGTKSSENNKEKVIWKELYKEKYEIEKKKRQQQEEVNRCCKWPTALIGRVPRPFGWPPFYRPGHIDFEIDLDPDLQEFFPHLRRRFAPANPLLQHIFGPPPSFFRI